MQTRIDSQERIFDTFHNVPFLLERASGVAMSHRADQVLQARVCELYRVLLRELPQLIKILLRQHTGKGRTRLFKSIPGEEARVIDASLESIKRSSRAVDVRIDIIQDQLSAETRQVVVANSDRLEDMRIILHDIQANTAAARLGTESALQREASREAVADAVRKAVADAMQLMRTPLLEEVSRVSDACRELAQTIQRRYTLVQPATPPQIQYSEENLWMTPLDAPLTPDASGWAISHPPHAPIQAPLDKWQPMAPPELKYSIPRLLEEPPPYTLAELEGVSYDSMIKLLAIPTSPSPFADLERVLRQGANLEQDALVRARWLITTERFATWVAAGLSSSSDIILVKGHDDENFLGKVSPLSVFCASLTTAMIRKSLTVLYHFCGEHAFPRDPISGPCGMLRSLIAQLTASRLGLTARLDNLEQTLFNEPQGMAVRGLMAVFEHLLREVPPGCTVYLILDNVSEFESRLHGWDDDICRIVGLLDELSRDLSIGVNLRILITCPIKSTVLCRQIDFRDHISLRAGNLHA